MRTARLALAGLFRDRRGTTAVEFALVAPALCTLVFGALGLEYGLWTWNGLQETASETARCVALSSNACATVTANCANGTSAGVCYAQTVAAARGLAGLPAADVAITTPSCGAASAAGYTQVVITYPVSLLGIGFSASSTSCVPNSH